MRRRRHAACRGDMKDEEKSGAGVEQGRSGAGTWPSPGLHGAATNRAASRGGGRSATAAAAGIRVLKVGLRSVFSVQHDHVLSSCHHPVTTQHHPFNHLLFIPSLHLFTCSPGSLHSLSWLGLFLIQLLPKPVRSPPNPPES